MTKRMSLWVLGLMIGAAGACAPERGQPAQSSAFDRSQLLEDLRVLSADDMEGRRVGTDGGAKARAFVLERFRASGLEPHGSYEQAFTFTAGRDEARREVTGVNVVGRVPGADASGPCVVVTAHYDHVGVRNGEVFNGADDNASGTAALFAIGRHFSAAPPEHCLMLAALDGEEGGLRGARAFVEHPPVPLRSIVLNVNLDMIGRDPDDTLYAVGTHHYPWLKPYLEQVAAGASVRLLMGHDEPGRAGVEDWTRDSDHFAFHEAQVPFVYFGVEDFPQHHQATDDYDTITHDFYVRAVETIIEALRVFDANLAAIAAARGER